MSVSNSRLIVVAWNGDLDPPEYGQMIHNGKPICARSLDSLRNQAITLKTPLPGSMSVMAMFRQQARRFSDAADILAFVLDPKGTVGDAEGALGKTVIVNPLQLSRRA
jgi:hypothetical protein